MLFFSSQIFVLTVPFFSEKGVIKIKSCLILKKVDYVFEFRHYSWFNETVYNFLENNKLIMVSINVSKKWTNLYTGYNPPLDIMFGNTIYIRMHGSKNKYCGSYDNKTLINMINYIKKNKFKNIYIYCI